MIRTKRFFAIALSAFMLMMAMAGLAPAAAAEVIIINPYEGVDWDNWSQYKTQLHTHTTASDGRQTMAEALESHYAAGYDFVAVTDHGLVDRGWIRPNYRPVFSFFWNLFAGGSRRPIVIEGLSEERLREMNDGLERGGRGMQRVPYGIEHNHPSPRVHLNSWFADWGNTLPGGDKDYATAVRNINRRGGLIIINHPSESAYNSGYSLAEAYEGERNHYVQKVQRLFERYPALIGIEIPEDRDRKLWDILLQNLAPQGRNVFGIGSSDSHSEETVDARWVWALMPESTVGHLRMSLENGAFFSAVRNESYLDEPHSADMPIIANIAVLDGTIKIMAENYDIIQWVSNGQVICTGDLLFLMEHIGWGAYVRAEVIGEGGILYTQPFLLSYEGMPEGNPVARNFRDDGRLIGLLRSVLNPAIRVIDQLWIWLGPVK